MSHLWVIGDSWTDPSFEENRLDGWSVQVASQLGVGLVCSGAGGAGYANLNSDRISYRTEAARGIGAGADAVVVFGSVNDGGHAAAEVADCARAVYRAVRALCPRAALLVVGPQYWAARPPSYLYELRDAVHDTALAAGADAWVDALEWMQGRPELIGPSLHPNATGHDLITELLIGPVSRALWPPPSDPPLPPEVGYAYPRVYRNSPPGAATVAA